MVSWKNLNQTLRKILILFLSIFLFPCISIALTEYEFRMEPFGIMLLPSADEAPELSVGVSMLSFPPGASGKIAFPFLSRATILIDAGLLIYPSGFGISGASRFHILKTSSRKWGVALQLQSLAGFAFWGGEGGGGVINAVELIASSPIKSNRINFGFALHTMPGSEFKPIWEKAKKYDIKNPQPTLFISFEHTGKRLGLFSENIIAAIGADDGWDSGFASLLGCKILIGKAKFKIGTGIAIQRFGTVNPITLPIPPIILIIIPI